MKLHVYHRTRYTYGSPVRESFNEARLKPVTSDGQVCHEFSLRVAPVSRVSSHVDFLNNCVHAFDVSEPHSELSVEATSLVTTPTARPIRSDQGTVALENLPATTAFEFHDFLQPSRFVDALAEMRSAARGIVAGQSDAWFAAQTLMHHVHANFEYRPAATHVYTPMSEVLKQRCGVCQDFAHVLIGLCRALQVPARYVSGYLYNGPVDQLRGAQATHAWVEVYLPGLGWCGLDPTNDTQPDERYVKIAAGRDYSDVSPLRGTYRGTAQRKLAVEVLVRAVEEQAA